MLCGIEPVGTVPDVTKLDVGQALYHIEGSLNSVLNYSFFQTKQMRQDFGASQLNGTIPVLMVFLARCGKTIENISPAAAAWGADRFQRRVALLFLAWTFRMGRSSTAGCFHFASGWGGGIVF